MTARHVAAGVVITLLLVLVGYVLPERTEARLVRLRERIARDPRARLRFYVRTLGIATGGVVLAALVVAIGGAGLGAAGTGWPDRAWRHLLPGLVGAALAVNVVLLTARLTAKRYDPAALDRDRQIERIDFLVPRTPAERRLWPLVAVAIGVSEEALFRGVFVLYVAALTGVPVWLLVVASAVVFGAGHRYQRWLGVVATGGLGLGFGIVTAATGTVWPAMVLHALVDLRIGLLRPKGQHIG
jgi:membrane protease YdiL (CAAX protease family)